MDKGKGSIVDLNVIRGGGERSMRDRCEFATEPS